MEEIKQALEYIINNKETILLGVKIIGAAGLLAVLGYTGYYSCYILYESCKIEKDNEEKIKEKYGLEEYKNRLTKRKFKEMLSSYIHKDELSVELERIEEEIRQIKNP